MSGMGIGRQGPPAVMFAWVESKRWGRVRGGGRCWPRWRARGGERGAEMKEERVGDKGDGARFSKPPPWSGGGGRER
jgi:hypothetical protein